MTIAAILNAASSPGWAYRPFVSTDAAVVGQKEAEIEFGYFGVARTDSKTTLTIPRAVLNYGVAENKEVVGEFEVEEPDDESVRLEDAALSLKSVLKEGTLQERTGNSFATETSVLLPANSGEERRLGFEETAILSAPFKKCVFHMNLGGGVDRIGSHGFLGWGIIGEWPIKKTLRIAGEINGENRHSQTAENSALVGVIWQSPRPNLFFDCGFRRGLSSISPDWQFTAGLTYGFLVAQLQESGKRERKGEPRRPF